MYNDIYEYNEKVEISLVQVLSIAMIVLITFILPVELIAYTSQNAPGVYTESHIATRSTSSTPTMLTGGDTGRVAGASTTKESEEGKILGISTETESGRLTLTGAGLLIMAMIATVYLIASNLREPKVAVPQRSLEDLDF